MCLITSVPDSCLGGLELSMEVIMLLGIKQVFFSSSDFMYFPPFCLFYSTVCDSDTSQFNSSKSGHFSLSSNTSCGISEVLLLYVIGLL